MHRPGKAKKTVHGREAKNDDIFAVAYKVRGDIDVAGRPMAPILTPLKKISLEALAETKSAIGALASI
jgi:5-enolpyruvylshikimate-3-phosphate synthase